jgi:hemolysin III
MVRKPLITQGYSLAEEIANSISHGIGLVFGIVGLVLLLVQAVDSNAGATAITSYSLYGGSMICCSSPRPSITRFRISGLSCG